MMKSFVILVCIHFVFIEYSCAQADTLNQLDKDNFKQGYWIVYGKDKPDKGYCDSCKIEEGRYLDNRKEGVWKKYHLEGTTIRLEGTYKNGRPDGVYTKFGSSGSIIEEGEFKPVVERNHAIRYFPSGCVETVLNEGKRDFYLNDCKNGSLYGTLDSSIRKSTTNGVYSHNMPPLTDSLIKNQVEGLNVSDGLSSLKCEKCSTKNGQKFDPNGLNKLYNLEDELDLDGEFKDGVLWNGKHYIYDSDGILLKIEVWKKGRYYSDISLPD